MIRREIDGGLLVLTLEHGKVNAFDLELVDALDEVIGDAGSADVVVLTGSGRAFSAGVDLHRLLSGGRPYVEEFVARFSETFESLLHLPIPLVVAVNGHAIAGGALVAAAADLTLMADGEGRIGAPELLVGVPFPTPALEILRFAWPNERLQSLLYRGTTVLPEQALAWGLVDELVPPEELLPCALRRARGLAAIPKETFRLAKQQLRRPLFDAIESQKPRYEARVRALWRDDAILEHIRSYLERTVGR